MLWRNPSFFWLLWGVVGLAVLLAWAYRRRRALLAVFAAAPLIERLTPNVDQRRRWWRSALRLVSLALLVVALAGPKWGFHWEEVQREGIDVHDRGHAARHGHHIGTILYLLPLCGDQYHLAGLGSVLPFGQ